MPTLRAHVCVCVFVCVWFCVRVFGSFKEMFFERKGKLTEGNDKEMGLVGLE